MVVQRRSMTRDAWLDGSRRTSYVGPEKESGHVNASVKT